MAEDPQGLTVRKPILVFLVYWVLMSRIFTSKALQKTKAIGMNEAAAMELVLRT